MFRIPKIITWAAIPFLIFAVQLYGRFLTARGNDNNIQEILVISTIVIYALIYVLDRNFREDMSKFARRLVSPKREE